MEEAAGTEILTRDDCRKDVSRNRFICKVVGLPERPHCLRDRYSIAELFAWGFRSRCNRNVGFPENNFFWNCHIIIIIIIIFTIVKGCWDVVSGVAATSSTAAVLDYRVLVDCTFVIRSARKKQTAYTLYSTRHVCMCWKFGRQEFQADLQKFNNIQQLLLWWWYDINSFVLSEERHTKTGIN